MIEQELKIALWGGNAAGKSTFLSALQISSVLEPGNWRIVGRDHVHPGSTAFLTHGSQALSTERRFPPATAARSRFSYLVTGRPLSGINSWLPLRRADELSFVLELQDDRDGAYLSAVEDAEDSLWAYLAECDGIIFLYDPLAETMSYRNSAYVLGALPMLLSAAQHAAPGRIRNGRLTHFVAICLAKYDEPIIFRRLREQDFIRLQRVGRYNVPVVIDPRQAADLFFDLLTAHCLENYFFKERVRYFATSSIGFYSDSGSTINLDDCYNVVTTPDGPRIRGEVHPVNVITPLVWLATSITKTS